MEPLKLAFLRLHLDPLCQLSEDDQVEYDGGSKEGVFTGIVEDDSVVATHEDLGGVLVHGTLAVADIGHIFDDNLREGGSHGSHC